jgi:DNA-binding MarR family transcriptional regulator
MKYNIEGFDQQKLVEMKLNSDDAIILRWFVDFYATGKMSVVKDSSGLEYKWVKYQSIIDDLPILEITNRQVIARHFNKMVKAGIIKKYVYKKNGTYTCFKLTDKFRVLIEKYTPINSIVDPPINSIVDTKDPSIKLNSSIKNTSREKSSGDKKTFNEIKEIFEKGSSLLHNDPYYHDGKEATNIKRLEKRYGEDTAGFEDLARKYFKMIKDSGDKFWKNQVFSPSGFNCHYNRIKAYKFSGTDMTDFRDKLDKI